MIRIGIIGCGKIAEVRHAPEFNENSHCKITAFYNRTTETAERFARQYGGKVYTSVEDLLSSDVDAVSVCVANSQHAAITIRALEAGKHVLCEKPMATTLEDCEDMVQASKDSGKYLMIAMNQRLAKAHIEAKKIIDSGEMGNLIAFKTCFAHPGPENWSGKQNTWFFDKRFASFGVMADLGVHKTDVIHFLTGERIVKTSAVITTRDKKSEDGCLATVDDNAFAIYTMESGVVGTMHVSWTNYGTEENSTTLYMKKGVIRIYDDPKYSLIVEKSNGDVISYQLDLLATAMKQSSGEYTSSGVIDTFINSITTNTPPALSGESALHPMQVIFANKRSAELGTAVDVD